MDADLGDKNQNFGYGQAEMTIGDVKLQLDMHV